MQKDKIRKQDLSGYLKLIYQAGFQHEHPQLFNIEDTPKKDRDTKEAVRFYKLIQEESSKRNIKPPELIDYLLDHRNELIELLETKAPALTKFTKIYEHAEMEKLKSQILKPGRLDRRGKVVLNEDYVKGEVEVWRAKDVEYYIKVEDMMRLGADNPKVFVSQLKNISLIVGMIQEQQFNNKTKEARCEFSLPEYYKRMGATKEEIRKGSRFVQELKSNLLTGAYTTYRIDKIKIDGQEYTAHGIPNFYTLLEPVKDHPGSNCIIICNDPWKSWVEETLNGKAPQFFIKNSKAIEDRRTYQRPYLFLFYLQLLKRKRERLTTMPIKIGNLLKDMKLPDKILIRPKECFKVLRECLIYFSEHYQPTPEIESFNIYNDFHETETLKLPLSVTEAFKGYEYEDIKGLLAAMGIKDIRKAYISFRRPAKKPKRKYKLNEAEEKILKRTLTWFENWPWKIPPEDRESLIKMYIKKLGHDTYKRIFEYEANKDRPNGIEFLTKVLPEIKKGGQRKAEGYLSSHKQHKKIKYL
jgi:hypothetical protein